MRQEELVEIIACADGPMTTREVVETYYGRHATIGEMEHGRKRLKDASKWRYIERVDDRWRMVA